MKHSNVFAFLAGLCVGGCGALLLCKKHFERKSQDEVSEIRQIYKEMAEKARNLTEEAQKDLNGVELAQMNRQKPDISEYMEKIRNYGYTNYAKPEPPLMEEEDEEEELPPLVEDPYADDSPAPEGIFIIEPDAAGEEYEVVYLTYYADGTLADDMNDILREPEDTIGPDALKHFGEYIDDVVYVRNTHLKADYEITRDPRTYAEAIERRPHIPID